ncbi:MAG: hypothetical protein K2J40_09695 [Ruminococcus sp.]|nr:hypothetical protein [Ruminococcus sp.]
MEKKIVGVFWAVAFFSAVLGGCDKNVPSDRQDITAPEIAETTEIIETSAATQATADDTTEPTTKVQSDFDFEKIVESTYICGQKLSYPLTWGQLGENFSLDSEVAYASFNYIYCYLNYMGQYLGVITFKDCKSVAQITENTQISSIDISDSHMEEFDVPKISVNGITFHDTHEDLYEALGDSYEISKYAGDISYSGVKYAEKYSFSFSATGEDELTSVSISFN